jgi:hypothetical protein
MPDPQQTYRLTFRPEPSSVPVAIRLRRLLKIAGRALALKCIRAEEVQPAKDPQQRDAS